jgi:hypothetical protein
MLPSVIGGSGECFIRSTIYGAGVHLPVNIAPALTWMFISFVTVLKPPQKLSNEGSAAGSSVKPMMGSDASDMIGIDVSSMVTVFLSESITSENVHGSARRSSEFVEDVSVPEQVK